MEEPMMELRNKHDKDKSWEMKSIWLRMEYLKHELAASSRLDGYVLEGHKEELKKLQKDYETLAWDGIYTDDEEDRSEEINERLDFLKKEIEEYYNKYNLMEDGTLANPHIPINKENRAEWTLQEATKIHSRYEPELAKLFNELDEIGINTQWDQKLTNPNTTWDKPNEDNPYPRTGGLAS